MTINSSRVGLWTETLKFKLKIASQQRNHGNNTCVDLWSQKGPTITLPLDKQANKTQLTETNCSGWVITNRQHKPYMCITHPPTSTTLHCFINSTRIDLFFKPESLLKKIPTSLYLYTNKQTRANSRNCGPSCDIEVNSHTPWCSPCNPMKILLSIDQIFKQVYEGIIFWVFMKRISTFKHYSKPRVSLQSQCLYLLNKFSYSIVVISSASNSWKQLKSLEI